MQTLHKPTNIQAYTNLPIPTSAPFTLAASPGRGWGAFATRNIPSNASILREHPIFTIPNLLITEHDLGAAVHSLPTSSQQQFFSLRDNGDTDFRCFTDAFVENSFM
ncbi:hypothetical protein N0V94_005485 [Neodidymelliopsis sp. IMI 364377]|nr:hypothetical protein N0V94_005485 [Neodidymelliopsis sp. IMI 364377]